MKKGSSILNKNYVVNELLIKEVVNQKLNVHEFLLLIAFINNEFDKLDVQKLSDDLFLKEEDILSALNSLIKKKLVNLVSRKDENGKLSDYIELDGISNLLENGYKSATKNNKKMDIYSSFEKEFGRTITPMEYEIINGWIDSNIKEDIILLALKEASYNGVNNIRYVDKVLFEWKRLGLNNTKDVENHLKKRNDNKSSKDLFDYDWVNVDE